MIKKLSLIAAVGIFFSSCNEQKTAYVDTTRVIQEYKEMEEVEAEFTSKSDAVRGQMDSIARVFQQEVQEYQSSMNSMSASAREAKEKELMQKQQMLQQRQQMQSNQLRQESTAVMDSLVEKVKDFVKVYGEENGYTYIFGSNESANIMYAEEGLDITDEVLKKLNSEYGGGDTNTEEAEEVANDDATEAED